MADGAVREIEAAEHDNSEQHPELQQTTANGR